MKGYGQKIDKSARTQLMECAPYFPALWGDSEETVMGLHYGSPEEGPDSIDVVYEAKKQLLGGVYNLVISGEKEAVCSEGDAEMFYKGRFIKGEAYFKPGKEGGDLAEILNGNSELIELLSRLDLLTMKVSCHDNRLTYSLSPFGGAYTYTVFPPMKYGGVLPGGDIKAIGRVMNLIAESFGRIELAAGAE